MPKISFRFFNDRVVRAVWDEENAKWWFSVPDVVGVLNGQGTYWKYLKNKLKEYASQLVGTTNQLMRYYASSAASLRWELNCLRLIRFDKSFFCTHGAYDKKIFFTVDV